MRGRRRPGSSAAEADEAALEAHGRMCQFPEAFQRFAPVAQWIEQRFPKPLVGRSIRLGGAWFLRA